MKHFFVILCICCPGFVFAQVVDTVSVRREVDSLVQLNRKLLKKGDYDEALTVIEAAEQRTKEVFGKISTIYGVCLASHGATLFNKGRYNEVEPLFLEAVSVQEILTGKNDSVYASRLYNLATLYKAMGRYESAESKYLEVRTIQKDVLKKVNPAFAKTLSDLGSLYMIMGNYNKSEPLLRESINVCEEVFGKEHQEYANALDNLAGLEKLTSHFMSADSLYLEAKDIRERLFGKDHPDYARSLNSLANLYRVMERYEMAESFLLEAKDIRGKIFGKNHPAYARTLSSLGNLFSGTGKYEIAEKMYLEAMFIQLKCLSTNHPDYAATVANLGVLYKTMGRYESAEPLYLEAKSIQEKVLGKDNLNFTINVTNLAFLYCLLGNYQLSEQLYIEAKSIQERIIGKEHYNYALTLSGLAALYYTMGQYESAEPLYLESISIIGKKLGKNHSDYAGNLSNLALLYNVMGRFDAAEPLLLEAKDIWEKNSGKKHSNYAVSLNNIATVYRNTNRFDAAESNYLEALEIWEKTIGKNHPQYASSLNNLTFLYRITSHPECAVNSCIEAGYLQRANLYNVSKYQSERELSQYIMTFFKNLNEYFSFVHSNPFLRSTISPSSYDNILFHKGFLLQAVNARNQIIQSDTATNLLDNLQKSYLRRLAREFAKPVAGRDTLLIAEWEEKSNAIEKELVRTVAGYGDIVKQVSWQEVQQKLLPNEAAVEFVSYKYYTPKPTDSTMYAALVLLPTDSAPHFIHLFEERQLQALFNRPGLDEKLIVKGLYGADSGLRNLLWQPLEPYLRDVKTVYYSPAGLLHRLNPAALLDESKQLVSAGRQWVRVGSTRELVTDRLADRSFARSESNDTGPLTALVYGGITYDMDSLAFAGANQTIAVDSNTNSFQRKDGNFRYIVEEHPTGYAKGSRGGGDGSWEPLKGSGREADEVNALLGAAGFHTEIQKGLSASEEYIKKMETGPRILHMATHGFAYPDPKKDPPKGFGDSEPVYKLQDDPMLRSGLVLAGANYYWKNKRPLTNHEDGVLVAYEVRDLNLRNTELAVLSACQTGLGDVVGSEGVYGLQRAFRIAGAKFLIVSLWHVPDDQTQELMRLFYQNWLEKQESLRDAFNHAQQTLRETEPNPYMWAGFVLIE